MGREKIINSSNANKWQPLNREQALAARDFSKAGETFVDYKGLLNEILYSVLTPMGYKVTITKQALQHIDKHLIPESHKASIPHFLNNPDLIVPSYEIPTTHLYYKVIKGILFIVPVHFKDGIRFVSTMHRTPIIKGLKEQKISQRDFLYVEVVSNGKNGDKAI